MDCVGTIFALVSGSAVVLTADVIVWLSGTPDVWNAVHVVREGALDATTLYEKLFVIVLTSVEAKMEGGAILFSGQPIPFWSLTSSNRCYFATNPLMFFQLSMAIRRRLCPGCGQDPYMCIEILQECNTCPGCLADLGIGGCHCDD